MTEQSSGTLTDARSGCTTVCRSAECMTGSSLDRLHCVRNAVYLACCHQL